VKEFKDHVTSNMLDSEVLNNFVSKCYLSNMNNTDIHFLSKLFSTVIVCWMT